ncbi:Crp/Fnr family transcriptional regulator [Microcoleus sp. ARI1-B5]|uniref:Crp/Fnr family transcriptional regulator n=1 Tax=unclassified Microcoleus TaxID=2642155 RepID=UPI002FD3BD2D
MKTEAFSELFPLFKGANPETLGGLLSNAVKHEYPPGRAVVMEDSWGNAIYFVVSGWVKVRRLSNDRAVSMAILGRGAFFGEMAILDESPRSNDVLALSPVRLISVTAQRFIQTLFKDPQLHHRMLQLMVRRLRQTNLRSQLQNRQPAVKLANTLVELGENYGQKTAEGRDIFNIPYEDLADVTGIALDETSKIMEKLDSKGWIKIDPDRQTIHLINLKHLMNLASQ